MTVTTIKIQSEVRDRLATVAAIEFAGATLSDTVDRLLAEHEDGQLRAEMATAYARLAEDPAGWAAYQAEVAEWDAAGAGPGEWGE
jgi:hypothetical protein